MGKVVGRAVVMKVADPAGGNFATIASLNTKTLTINNTAIDVTTPDEANPGGKLWRESLAGMKSVDLSGDGIFDSGANATRLQTIADSEDQVADFQLVVPELGTFEGEFRMTSYELGGETEGGTTFSISLESNGVVTFTAI